MSGIIYYGPGSKLGEIDANTETGIFGTAGNSLISRTSASPIPVGYRQDVKTGPALLRTRETTRTLNRALTHVFVQDSTKGYGIFIENMIKH